MKQEYKVLNEMTGNEVFFFKHSFKTARWHADEYIRKNTEQKNGKYTLYRLNENIGERWVKVTL